MRMKMMRKKKKITLKKIKNYNDSNFWEIKNRLPEKVRKEVDKKTNIIFNYNPNTYEYDNKDSIDEEDELLRDAMELEQKEKMEKNKKLKLSLPYRIKPYNLKTKTNPVQNLFSASPHNDGLDDDNGGDDFYNKKIKTNNIDDNDD